MEDSDLIRLEQLFTCSCGCIDGLKILNNVCKNVIFIDEELSKCMHILQSFYEDLENLKGDYVKAFCFQCFGKCLINIYRRFLIGANADEFSFPQGKIVEIFCFLCIINLKLTADVKPINEIVFALSETLTVCMTMLPKFWKARKKYEAGECMVALALDTVMYCHVKFFEDRGYSPQMQKLLRKNLICLKIVYCEVLSNQLKVNKITDVISEIKESIFEFPEYLENAAHLFLNIGMLCYNEGKYHLAVCLLELCLNIDEKMNLNFPFQLKVIKCLVDVYSKYKLEDCEIPANIREYLMNVDISHLDPYYIVKFIDTSLTANLCILEILILSLFEQDKFDNYIVFKTVLLLYSHKRFLPLLDFIGKVKNFLSDKYKLHLLLMEMEIYLNGEDGHHVFATYNKIVELVLEGRCEKNAVAKCVCDLVIKFSDSKFFNCRYEEALFWYENSMTMYREIDGNEDGDDICYMISCVKVKICFCLFEKKDYMRVIGILQSGKIHKKSKVIFSHIKLKTAIVLERNDKAMEALTTLGEETREMIADNKVCDDISTICILNTCCEEAIQLRKTDFLQKILHNFVESNIESGIFALKVLQHLLMLYNMKSGIKNEDQDVFHLANKAIAVVSSIQEYSTVRNIHFDLSKELKWFAKACWHFAVGVSSNKLKFKFYKLCCGFQISVMKDSENDFVQYKTYCLLTVASGIETVRSEEEKNENKKRAILNLVLKISSHCLSSHHSAGELLEILKTTHRMFHIFQYDARLLLKDESPQEIFDSIATKPLLNSTSFETIAALTFASGIVNYKTTIQALKIAVNKYLATTDPDYNAVSKNFSYILQVLFYAQEQQMHFAKEECFTFCKNLLCLIEKANYNYPESKMSWFMSKAWNNGLKEYYVGNTENAMKWCSLALECLEHMPSHRQSKKQLAAAYKTLFSSNILSSK